MSIEFSQGTYLDTPTLAIARPLAPDSYETFEALQAAAHKSIATELKLGFMPRPTDQAEVTLLPGRTLRRARSWSGVNIRPQEVDTLASEIADYLPPSHEEPVSTTLGALVTIPTRKGLYLAAQLTDGRPAAEREALMNGLEDQLPGINVERKDNPPHLSLGIIATRAKTVIATVNERIGAVGPDITDDHTLVLGVPHGTIYTIREEA